MADILIRGLDPSLKKELASRAARNGRSQQAEAKTILESSLREGARDWVALLAGARNAVGGVELELPERHRPRSIDVEGWR